VLARAGGGGRREPQHQSHPSRRPDTAPGDACGTSRASAWYGRNRPARARSSCATIRRPGTTPGDLAAKTWEITSLEIGTHAVFTNGATLVAADGTSSGVPMPELTLRVDSLLAGTTNTALRDLKALARWPRPGLHSAFHHAGRGGRSAAALISAGGTPPAPAP
jgi:hypothetical protein